MLWLITRAITSTCYSKTEQIVVVPLNKNNGPFKIGGFFAHPVDETIVRYTGIEAVFDACGIVVGCIELFEITFRLMLHIALPTFRQMIQRLGLFLII